MQLEQLIPLLHFSPEIEQALCQIIAERETTISEFSKNAYIGEYLCFPICRHILLNRLATFVYLLPQIYQKYRDKGVEESVILDTFRDISLRANSLFQNTGKIGLTKDDVIWLRHIFHAELFQIGSMQFQPFEMVYLDNTDEGQDPFMTFLPEAKAVLPKGTPVINCHIPHGADLSPEAVEYSLSQAKLFFEKTFPEVSYRAFVCYSWLLYPPMRQYLKEDSNIFKFAERFEVIGSRCDYLMAFKHLFPYGKAAAFQHSTSLLRSALDHKKSFGFACGTIRI